jgi:hypothetical protein
MRTTRDHVEGPGTDYAAVSVKSFDAVGFISRNDVRRGQATARGNDTC